ncbi:MAG: GDSL-type esterase/lipase family protein [Pirellulaceae bacterium]|nr:GDSL-type esterase/lipase family protein [Pirellulaceae bacterium]
MKNTSPTRFSRFCYGLATLGFLAVTFLAPASARAQEQGLDLNQGDAITIIGNTLAERMQHDAWMEALLQNALQKELVIRNLGFSADTPNLRLRSSGFGSPDDWLSKLKTDVVFAFFGYNESFAGEAGLVAFEDELTQFIKHTQAQKYNGESAPQLVLFSPTACENLKAKTPRNASEGIAVANANLPDFAKTNQRLQLYTNAMRRIAKQNNVTFVDLFEPTSRAWKTGDQYTINGVHLNENGNALVAEIIFKSLFGEDQSFGNPRRLVQVRDAVRDKNWHWFHRYRTTDGYSTYGGRADLRFTDGQTNREVVQRELEVLDFMTAERDKKVHALATGKDYQVDDSKAPPFIPVVSNKPGEGPGGSHVFLSGEEAVKKIEVHEGMEVNLFASEEEFPELASPVQMSFDTKGRLWVAAWPTYPHWQPIVEEMNDKLLILSDTDNDGKADDVKVFADKLHNPTGFEFWNGGVIVGQVPDLLFLKDTDGDDVADVRIRLLHGIDSADTHHSINSFVMGPGGALYFQEGTFHHTQMETPWREAVRVVNGGVYRFEPRTFKLDAYVSYGFANPHGHVFDDWGQDFVTDGTGNVNYYAAPFSGNIEYPQKHSRYFPFFQQWVRPCGATEILSSAHFPEALQGNYLIVNVIGFQGVLQYEVKDDGSGFLGEEVKPIIKSSDPNFRPVDIEVGPDGAIYVLDWQNPIIGHMQHNLRDPNRDKVHGRVYRITQKDRPLSKVVDLTELSPAALLDQLKSSEARNRYRARIELSGRDTADVMAAVAAWVPALDPADPDYVHQLLEALWMTQQHNQVDVALLKQLLVCDDHRARAAATRVLCYTRDAVPEALTLLETQINDQHPRVRLEAIRALSFMPSVEAAEVLLQARNYPLDKFSNYCLNETMRVMNPLVKKHISEGKPFAEDNPVGLRFIIADLSSAEISKMPRNRTVFEELLSREGILHEFRYEAAEGLAKENGTDVNMELLSAIERVDKSDMPNAQSILGDLTHVFLHGDGKGVHGNAPWIDLSKYRDQLDNLAANARRPITRQVAFATLIAAEKSADRLWNKALKSPAQFRDLVSALALVDEAEVKKALAPRVTKLLNELPPEIEQQIDDDGVTKGRFIRIEIPGEKKILTLAEVQVMSGGVNIAARGKASQSSTSHDGAAVKAIDGNANPAYAAGGQTHTRETERNPWWELDLGATVPLDEVIIWNRAEGNLGQRLNGFTLQILGENRNKVFEKKNLPAPKSNTAVTLQGDPRSDIRSAAIAAAIHLVPGEASTFDAFADFILTNRSRGDAIRGMARLPKRSWVNDQVTPLVENVIERVSSMSAKQRTMPYVIDEISLGKKLATAMPAAQAKAVRSQLNDLGINVVVLRPVPHRMQYDLTTFFVEAGKPFQLILDNTDIMPHNVVITTPGSYAKVGIAAELMATESDAIERHYVPNLSEVLYASKMLQPGQLERLDIIAPSEPGEYPYVCTYPGHWRRMYGVMHVVEDLESVPMEALAPTVDSEIAMRPFVRDWKLEELLGDLERADSGRSFEQGRALFTELSCAQCHRVGDSDGGDVGPNIFDLKAKFAKGDMDRAGLLKSLVQPSETIDEKYRSWIILDLDGRTRTGVIAERTPTELRLLANPLDNGEPVTIALDDIDEEIESKISMMPQGLLNTCSKDEILDLLMYIESVGDKDHPAFKNN